jgi:hypothetical protein
MSFSDGFGRDCPHRGNRGARSGQGSKTAEGGEFVVGLVLDGEHGALGLIGQSKPASSAPLFPSVIEPLAWPPRPALLINPLVKLK